MSQIRVTLRHPRQAGSQTVTIRADAYSPRPAIPSFQGRRDLYEDRIMLSTQMNRHLDYGSNSTTATMGTALSPQISPMTMEPVVGMYPEPMAQNVPIADMRPQTAPQRFERVKRFVAKACCKVLGTQRTQKYFPSLSAFVPG